MQGRTAFKFDRSLLMFLD